MKFVSFFMLFFNAYFLVHNVMLSSIHVSHTIARIFLNFSQYFTFILQQEKKLILNILLLPLFLLLSLSLLFFSIQQWHDNQKSRKTEKIESAGKSLHKVLLIDHLHHHYFHVIRCHLQGF